VASDDKTTVLGLPEILLGLIPGAGGTQRLPRLVGLAGSLNLILTGRKIRAQPAKRLGLVDDVVPASSLLDVAREAALGLADGTLRPRRRGIPFHERALRSWIFRRARASVRKKTGDHYPAPYGAIEAVEEGTARSLREGLDLEARLFGQLSVSSASRALVSVFLATQAIKKDFGVPEGTTARTVEKVAILGAGFMGAGIAAAAADAGIAVRLKDAETSALGRGLRHARESFEERRRRGRLTAREVQGRMDRIAPTLDLTGFRQADLVIEAVFEDLELKRRVLAECESVIREDCVYASNTSALPIAEIASGGRRPSRILGMHFFSPVEKMPLVEVIVTPETDAWTTATAVGFGRRLGKHVIVVRDGPGFFTTRTLAPYLSEAARLVEEGATVEAVDEAMIAFGFPVGPLALLDEVGIDVAGEVAKTLHARLGERFHPAPAMDRVVEDGRRGRKNGRGFYVYERRGKRPDRSLYRLLASGAERRPVEPRAVQDRCLFALLNEAVRCVQDGILRSPRDGDMGAIFGLGFPPFLGGPFRYLDHLGARFSAQVLERLAAVHGPRFSPAPLLAEMVRDARSFHK
jgi:3-hydroxyacyl-CoA dehydrogenase/enoyl-CoA hydratase/3-hydroxybutyryl-CoA epimerase